MEGPTLKLVAAVNGSGGGALCFLEDVLYVPKIGKCGSPKVLGSALPFGVIMPTEGGGKETDLMEKGGSESP